MAFKTVATRELKQQREKQTMSRTASVDEWTEILSNLVEGGKVRLTPEETVRGEAWRLAQQEEELAQLRALSAGEG